MRFKWYRFLFKYLYNEYIKQDKYKKYKGKSNMIKRFLLFIFSTALLIVTVGCSATAVKTKVSTNQTTTTMMPSTTITNASSTIPNGTLSFLPAKDTVVYPKSKWIDAITGTIVIKDDNKELHMQGTLNGKTVWTRTIQLTPDYADEELYKNTNVYISGDDAYFLVCGSLHMVSTKTGNDLVVIADVGDILVYLPEKNRLYVISSYKCFLTVVDAQTNKVLSKYNQPSVEDAYFSLDAWISNGQIVVECDTCTDKTQVYYNRTLLYFDSNGNFLSQKYYLDPNEE